MSGRDALIVVLPEHPESDIVWLRVVDDAIVQRGGGSGWLGACGLTHLPEDDRVMLVAPTAPIALHWIGYPDMPVGQGRAAARLAALESSIGGGTGLLAVADDNDDPARPHAVAVVSKVDLQHWLVWARHHGLDPDIVIPSALLVERPVQGFHRALVGATLMLRGPDLAIAADDPLAATLVGDDAVADLPSEAVDRAMLANLAMPALNLRQGAFARRRRPALDRKRLKRIGLWAGLILLASLLLSLIAIVKYHGEAGRLDKDSIATAQKVLPNASDPIAALAELDMRLAARGAGGKGFTDVASGLFAAMQGAPDVTITSLRRDPDGMVRATLVSARAEDINTVLLAIQANGFTITATSSRDQGGRVLADITVQS